MANFLQKRTHPLNDKEQPQLNNCIYYPQRPIKLSSWVVTLFQSVDLGHSTELNRSHVLLPHVLHFHPLLWFMGLIEALRPDDDSIVDSLNSKSPR